MSGATPPFPYIRVMQKNNFYLSYLLYLRYLNHSPIQPPTLPPQKPFINPVSLCSDQGKE